MHASLATSSDGIPLGLASTRFWSRRVFKNTTQLKRHVNPTRIPIAEKESVKWLENLKQVMNDPQLPPEKIINIGDRENDIYEYFQLCSELGCYFLIRSCVNRLANETTIAEEVGRHEANYQHTISFKTPQGENIKAKLALKIKNVTLHPPIGKDKSYHDLPVTVISAVEQLHPKDREQIKWTLITNLPVTNKADAVKALNWYK